MPKTAVLLLFLLLPLLAAPVSAQDAGLEVWRSAPQETRRFALALARRAFDAYALRREVIEPPAGIPPPLRRRAGVFVSAMRNGAPRCCMGTLYPTEPDIAHEIVSTAVAAAGRDRRFTPIKPAELKGLTLIVTILGPPRALAAGELESLDPDRDGLAVQYRDRFGVVLTGETRLKGRMLAWARIRAGAPPGAAVRAFRLEDVRLVEGLPDSLLAPQ